MVVVLGSKNNANILLHLKDNSLLQLLVLLQQTSQMVESLGSTAATRTLTTAASLPREFLTEPTPHLTI